MRKKTDIRLIARIYAASLLSNALGAGAFSPLLDENESTILAEELEKISIKISSNNSFSSLDQIIEHVDSSAR